MVALESSGNGSSFGKLGLMPQLCEACESLGFKEPTDIQKEAIPLALEGAYFIDTNFKYFATIRHLDKIGTTEG